MSPAVPSTVVLPAAPAATARGTLAVTIHEIEPATWERCALLRDWLADHGVARATLLVVPAPDLHPFDRRCPALQAWLEERIAEGDEVAQHGLLHRRTRPGGGRRQGAGRTLRDAAEFVGLDPAETARALDAGRRILADAGIVARGFVAPGFAYTPALHDALRSRYSWWATAAGLHRAAAPRPLRSHALGGGSTDPVRRAASPFLVRTASRIAGGGPVRLELRPGDVDHPRSIAAAQAVLRRHAHRRAVTCGQLAAV
jgi:predicted deacetylase